jgi:hypothetical protein
MKINFAIKIVLVSLLLFITISTNVYAQLKNDHSQKSDTMVEKLFEKGYYEQALLYNVNYINSRTREQKYDRCLIISTFVGATVITGSLFLGWYLTDSTNYEEAAIAGVLLGGLFGYSVGASYAC